MSAQLSVCELQAQLSAARYALTELARRRMIATHALRMITEAKKRNPGLEDRDLFHWSIGVAEGGLKECGEVAL